MRGQELKTQYLKNVPLSNLVLWDRNPRYIPPEAFERLKNKIEELGVFKPLLAIHAEDTQYAVIGGNQRLKAYRELGFSAADIILFPDLTDKKIITKIALADNQSDGITDLKKLQILLDDFDISVADLEDYSVSGDSISISAALDDIIVSSDAEIHAKLTEKFLVPPFSVLDTRAGYWQERKQLWRKLGIKSEVGRSDNLQKVSPLPDFAKGIGFNHLAPDTSIFDPVLCEVVYSWFTKAGMRVLDPFAGGSVRGVVANFLDRKYTGIELRKEQVEANLKNTRDICTDDFPQWIVGDSDKELDKLQNNSFDFLFSCPPYADLEVYSDDPADLSNMPYPQFLKTYRSIIAKSCAKLKDNSFAVFVVGEVRGKDGNYYNFVADTIQAFKDAGLKYYNEIILLNVVGTGSIRAPKQFNASRKVAKCHQNVLVFLKGDAKEAAKNLGTVEVMEMDGEIL
jgi:DNA modification methylase